MTKRGAKFCNKNWTHSGSVGIASAGIDWNQSPYVYDKRAQIGLSVWERESEFVAQVNDHVTPNQLKWMNRTTIESVNQVKKVFSNPPKSDGLVRRECARCNSVSGWLKRRGVLHWSMAVTQIKIGTLFKKKNRRGLLLSIKGQSVCKRAEEKSNGSAEVLNSKDERRWEQMGDKSSGAGPCSVVSTSKTHTHTHTFSRSLTLLHTHTHTGYSG